MSVIVDTGGRSSYSATLTDEFPITIETIPWGDMGEYMQMVCRPARKRYYLTWGSVAVTLYIEAGPDPEEPGEGITQKCRVQWALKATVGDTTYKHGMVMDRPETYESWDTLDCVITEAGGYQDYSTGDLPGGVPGGTMTISIGFPLRKLAEITTHARTEHYSGETASRWGKQVGEEDEVVDLREWQTADVYWWEWPDDGPVTVKVSNDSSTLFTWNQAVSMLPSRLVGACTFDFGVANWRFAPDDATGSGFGRLSLLMAGSPGFGADADDIYLPNEEDPDNFYDVGVSGEEMYFSAEKLTLDGYATCNPSFTGSAYPLHKVSVRGELVSVHDEPYPAASFTVGTYAALEPVSGAEDPTYPVETAIPKTGEPGSTALTWSMPGYKLWQGRVYSAQIGFYGGGNIGSFTKNDVTHGMCGLEWALPVTGNEWRLVQQVPGLDWTALTLTQEASHVIETFASAVNGWAAAGGETVSISSGALKIEGGNPKVVEKTYDDIGTDVWWDHLRYWVVDCTAAAADVVLTVTIGSKVWTVTGDANGDFLIDLCAPSNASGVDYSSTRYEREYASGAESLSEGGWGWGLNGLLEQTVQLSFATADDVLINEIRAVAAGQQGEARHSVQFGETVSIDERLRIEDTTDEPPHQVWAQLGLTHWLSGKVAGQEAAGTLEEKPDATAPDPPQLATPWTINQMYNAFATRYDDEKGLPRIANTGYKASRTPTTLTVGEQSFTYYPKAEWCNNTQYAYHLVPNFKEGTGPLALLAHYAVDRISFGPGAASQIKVRKIYQGGVNGIVESNDVPAAQTALNVKVDGTKIDSTSTGNTGVYWLPATPEWDDWHTEAFDIMPNGEDPQTATHTGLIHAMFLRACLTAEVSAQGGGLTMVKTSAGRIYRAYTSGTKIKFDVYTVGARTWSTAIDLCDGTQPSLLMYDSVPGTKRTRELYCYYVRDGQIHRRKSVSEGQTWGAEDSSGIMATKPFLQYDPDTSTTYFLYYDGGTIKFQLSYDHGTTWSVPANVVSASDDFMSLQLAYEPDSSGKRKRALILSYITGAGAVAVKKSFDDGHTWG
jgi:hypothetical protein